MAEERSKEVKDCPSCLIFSCGRYGKATLTYTVDVDVISRGVNLIVSESFVTFAVVCYL